MSDAAGWEARVDPGATAFFLDVDGTLLDFKDNPGDVVADEDLRSLLGRLRFAAQGALALVSGRTLADLDRIVAPLVLPMGGTHGAELRFADGRRETVHVDLDPARRRLGPFVASRPGLRLEDKGNAIAVHYRQAPSWADELATFLAGVVATEPLSVQHGKFVAEVKSNRIGKDRAIAALMASPPFAGRAPLFIGDDLTDEHGFEEVNASGGLSVKVGSEPTVARQHLRDPHDVRRFLRRVSES